MTALVSSFTVDDIARVRADTPGLSSRIHLDNCGSSLVSSPVVEAIQQHMALELEYGGYVAQEQQSARLENVYALLAKLLGGQAEDYAVVGSAVDGWTKAFYSVPLKSGDNIVTAYNDYCSNHVACLQRAKRDGVEVRVARSNADGSLDVDHLASLLDADTKLISLVHAPSASGQIAPVHAVGQLARQHDLLFLLDACQSVGQLPVNFDEIGCDMATGTGRKFLRGPRGVGFLFVNERARKRLDPVVLTNQAAAWVADDRYELREDARMFEAWERSCVNQLGFGAAIEYLLEVGVDKASERTLALAGYLRQQLPNVPKVQATCPEGASGAIVTFVKEGWEPAALKQAMEKQSIAVQVSQIVHERLDLGARGFDSVVRISPHYYNSEAELHRFLEALEAL